MEVSMVKVAGLGEWGNSRSVRVRERESSRRQRAVKVGEVYLLVIIAVMQRMIQG